MSDEIDHSGCWTRFEEDRKVINAARGLLELATKDALGPMYDAMADEHGPDTDADILWGRLHALDHAIRDRDAAIEKQGKEYEKGKGFASDRSGDGT